MISNAGLMCLFDVSPRESLLVPAQTEFNSIFISLGQPAVYLFLSFLRGEGGG